MSDCHYALCDNCSTRTAHEITTDEEHDGSTMRRTIECQNCGTTAVETWEFRRYERIDAEATT